jgi:hypothetical protein
MRARQLISRAGLPPHELDVVLDGFEDAWAELAPEAGPDAMVIEATRLRLAAIVLEIAKSVPIDRGQINVAAVEAFRSKRASSAKS